MITSLFPVYALSALCLVVGLISAAVSLTSEAPSTAPCFTDIECCTMFDDCDQPIFGGAQ